MQASFSSLQCHRLFSPVAPAAVRAMAPSAWARTHASFDDARHTCGPNRRGHARHKCQGTKPSGGKRSGNAEPPWILPFCFVAVSRATVSESVVLCATLIASD